MAKKRRSNPKITNFQLPVGLRSLLSSPNVRNCCLSLIILAVLTVITAYILIPGFIGFFWGDDDDRVAQLYKISGCDDESRVADIVFVHGLDGDYKTTWHPDSKSDAYFPKWIGELNSNVGVWSFDYPANKFVSAGGTMPIPTRGSSLLYTLATFGLGQDSDRPLIFVTHSLGGLVVKSAIRTGFNSEYEPYQNISHNTSGIVFLAVPNAGSNLANWLDFVAGRYTSCSVDELKSANPYIEKDNEWYSRNAKSLGIDHIVFFENQLTRGMLVVDASSAKPLRSDHAIGIDANHVTISKPTEKDLPLVTGISQFIENNSGRQRNDIGLRRFVDLLNSHRTDISEILQSYQGKEVQWLVKMTDQTTSLPAPFIEGESIEGIGDNRILIYSGSTVELDNRNQLTLRCKGVLGKIRNSTSTGKWIISINKASYEIAKDEQ